MLLALVMTVMAASAEAGFELTVGTSEHGKIAFTVDGQSVDYAQEGDKVEVTITPDDYFVVNEVEGQWYVSADVAKHMSAPCFRACRRCVSSSVMRMTGMRLVCGLLLSRLHMVMPSMVSICVSATMILAPASIVT